jgi:hypothetical protein
LGNEQNIDEFINVDLNKELLTHDKLRELVLEGMERKKIKG